MCIRPLIRLIGFTGFLGFQGPSLPGLRGGGLGQRSASTVPVPNRPNHTSPKPETRNPKPSTALSGIQKLVVFAITGLCVRKDLAAPLADILGFRVEGLGFRVSGLGFRDI